MTVLVAARDKKTNQIHILSDTMASDNIIAYLQEDKVVKLNNVILWFSWDILAQVAVNEYLFNEIKDIQIDNKRDVIELFKKIEETMIKEFWSKRTISDDRDYIEIAILIVTNKGKIFTCTNYLSVTEEKDFGTIGSGMYHAQAMLHLMYELNIVSVKNLLTMMEAVYRYKYSCWMGTHLISLTYENNEQSEI